MGLKPDLSVKISGINFKNPVWVASGTFGYAEEFKPFFDVKKLGAIVTKTITMNPRLGNPPHRIYETPSGMLNAIGLQNVGAKRFISDKLPYLESLKVPIIVSVMGYSFEEFSEVIKALAKKRSIAGFELNLSCPNVKYQRKKTETKMFCHDAELVKKLLAKLRGLTSKPLIAKLGPDVSNIGAIAKAAEDGGADAVSLINTMRAMSIDIHTRRPHIRNNTAGLSGPCIKPVAVRMVWEAARAVRIPVIGIGGISNAEDAVEFLIAGATAIQVGTANFINPHVCPEIIKGIESFLRTQKLKSVKQLIGSIRIYD